MTIGVGFCAGVVRRMHSTRACCLFLAGGAVVGGGLLGPAQHVFRRCACVSGLVVVIRSGCDVQRSMRQVWLGCRPAAGLVHLLYGGACMMCMCVYVMPMPVTRHQHPVVSSPLGVSCMQTSSLGLPRIKCAVHAWPLPMHGSSFVHSACLAAVHGVRSGSQVLLTHAMAVQSSKGAAPAAGP